MINAEELRNQAKGIRDTGKDTILSDGECFLTAALIVAQEIEKLTQAVTKLTWTEKDISSLENEEGGGR